MAFHVDLAGVFFIVWGALITLIGLSTLALPSFIAVAGIVGGAALGIRRFAPVAALATRARDDMDRALEGLGSLFLAGDKPAIRKALLRLRYLDKFAEEARARRTNIERPRA